MALRVRIAPTAAAQVRQAAAWWSEHRAKAPGAVRDDINEALALLSHQPALGSRCDDRGLEDVRRLLLGRLGYFLYYRVSGETLDVLAFWHARRQGLPRI